MRRSKNKRYLFSIFIFLILAVVVFLAWPAKQLNTNLSPATSTPPAVASNPVSAFNKALYPTDQASSLWVVVNKGRALPATYVPANLVVPNVPLRLSAAGPEMHLRSDSASALENLFAAAKTQGLNLMLASGYRSYADQETVHNNLAASEGAASADTDSARPGHSEHQTGLAADLEPSSRVCEVESCFASTPEGQWLAANCYKYGFIIRYQQNTQNLTGYVYEPWHVRFVGKALAAQINQTGQTLEQFFNLPIYTAYPAQSLTLSG